MTLKQALAANRWLRARFAFLIVAVLYMPVAAVLSAAFGSAWVLAPVAVYATAGGVCWVPARWTERALKAARVAAEREAAELRTPRAPDAGPDQCPVCGYDDLPYWREMDAWSLREGRERHVQPYGKHEAHRFCKELVPWQLPPKKLPPDIECYGRRGDRWLDVDRRIEPGQWAVVDALSPFAVKVKSCAAVEDGVLYPYRARLREPLPRRVTTAVLRRPAGRRDDELVVDTSPTPLGVHYTCRFCGEGRHAPDMATAEARLIVHSKECPERPRAAAPSPGLMLPKGWKAETVIDPGRVFTTPDGEQHVYCGPIENAWLRPDPKARRRP